MARLDLPTEFVGRIHHTVKLPSQLSSDRPKDRCRVSWSQTADEQEIDVAAGFLLTTGVGTIDERYPHRAVVPGQRIPQGVAQADGFDDNPFQVLEYRVASISLVVGAVAPRSLDYQTKPLQPAKFVLDRIESGGGCGDEFSLVEGVLGVEQKHFEQGDQRP